MAEYPFFPAFVDLSDRRALVVGGGRIAARRASTLSQFCPNVTVVAPAIHPDIAALAARGQVKVVERAYRDGDLDGAELVLACTDDGALNAAICAACAARGIPANDAGDRANCSFYFPGIARSGSAVVGVTACGADHRRARALRERIQAMLDGDD